MITGGGAEVTHSPTKEAAFEMPSCRRTPIGQHGTSIVASLWMLVASLLLVTSQAATAAPPMETPPPAVQIRLQDTAQPVRLRAEQVLELRLESNPSTGYCWDLVADSPDALGAEAPLLQSIAEPEYEPASPLLGARADQIMRLRATREGTQDYQLVYHRPLEKDAEPLRVLPLHIESIGPFTDALASTDTSAPEAQADVSALLPEDVTVEGLPSRWHWCEHDGCTPIKAQGSCGSCWTFGTVGALECSIRIQDGVTRNLAEQYLLSCNTDGWGCNGGWFAHSYHIWKKPPGELYAGAVYENDFPYWGYEVACNPPHTHHEKITSWSYVVSTKVRPAVADIKRAIYDYGPVAASVCVGWRFNNYSGGVFTTNECQDVNHAVVLVGWDDSQGTNGIWYLRNSWGTYWGENGYMRIAYGVCNVGYAANYIVYGSDHPSAPRDLVATPISTTHSVELSWTDNSSNETGFDIERSLTGIESWSQIATVSSDVTTYEDSGSSEGVYFYRVRAHNVSQDYSGYTAIRSAAFGLDSITDLPIVYSSTEHRLLDNAEAQCEVCGER